jgi:predicted nucleic acid-binding protein
MLIYCDSAILIYYIEGSGSYRPRAQARLSTLFGAGDKVIVSDLVRLECRVHPLRRSDSLVLDKFDVFFALPDVRFAPITSTVFDRATQIRAQWNLAVIDAIHLAAALEFGCHRFLTNDIHLTRCTAIATELLP